LIYTGGRASPPGFTAVGNQGKSSERAKAVDMIPAKHKISIEEGHTGN